MIDDLKTSNGPGLMKLGAETLRVLQYRLGKVAYVTTIGPVSLSAKWLI
jgi:hypothetical protein